MIDAFALYTEDNLGRVLVVDDEADTRMAVNVALSKSGYQVIEAESGEKAIETINSADNALAVDLILCDLQMPKVNGMDTIQYFLDEYPSRPVIVLTGYPDIQQATHLLREGVADYLIKPVERKKLAAAVANAIKRRRFQIL